MRSTGAAVARRFPDGWRLLVLRLYRNWDFPKGLAEGGEAPLDTALREVKEETGLDDLRFPWGWEWRETELYAGGKVARYYLAESPAGKVSLPVSPELGRPEHHEFRWVGLDDAWRLMPPRLEPVLEWIGERLA